MASVWVIEDGEYSDYAVKGVYSSKANAEMALARGQSGEIAEWTLDPCITEWTQGLRFFRVVMNRDGDTDAEEITPGWHNEGIDGPFWMGRFHGKFGGQMCVRCFTWAASEQEAVKITNEKRIRMIAEGKWA